MNVTAQPVQFCHAYSAPLTARFSQGRSKLWTALKGIAALARLDLYEHADKLEALSFSKTAQRLLLRLNAQPRLALLQRYEALV